MSTIQLIGDHILSYMSNEVYIFNDQYGKIFCFRTKELLMNFIKKQIIKVIKEKISKKKSKRFCKSIDIFIDDRYIVNIDKNSDLSLVDTIIPKLDFAIYSKYRIKLLYHGWNITYTNYPRFDNTIWWKIQKTNLINN